MRAGQRLVRQRQYGAVRQLLKCVGESGTATKNDCDALILSCVSVADKGPADVSDKPFKDSRMKIDIECTVITNHDHDLAPCCLFGHEEFYRPLSDLG